MAKPPAIHCARSTVARRTPASALTLRLLAPRFALAHFSLWQSKETLKQSTGCADPEKSHHSGAGPGHGQTRHAQSRDPRDMFRARRSADVATLNDIYGVRLGPAMLFSRVFNDVNSRER